MGKKVIFARVSPEAHAWITKKVSQSKEKNISASVVVERLLMNDRNKVQANRKRRAEKRPDASATI